LFFFHSSTVYRPSQNFCSPIQALNEKIKKQLSPFQKYEAYSWIIPRRLSLLDTDRLSCLIAPGLLDTDRLLCLIAPFLLDTDRLLCLIAPGLLDIDRLSYLIALC